MEQTMVIIEITHIEVIGRPMEWLIGQAMVLMAIVLVQLPVSMNLEEI